MKVFALFALLLASVSAFMPATPATSFVAKAGAAVKPSASSMQMSVFTDATEAFSKDYPDFYKAGWGPTTKAERWNGRHAMFGWVLIVATGYAKAHGLIPDPEVALNLKEWGTLSILAGPQTISNERAVVLIANVHALFMSLCAAFAPLSFQDPLLIPKGQKDEPAAGLIPAIVPGLTKEAELLNGRLAMLGLVLVMGHSLATGTPFLNSVDLFLGNRLGL
uniref:Light-harvesting protein XLH1 n=1 Tax=Tribonema minus TaxID=303371 RepID=UPI003FA61575